jgi:Holliday junction resolvasome RuvABC endonuclease subunit
MGIEMIVVGLDPSLRNFGMVKAELNIDTFEIKIIEMKTIETSKGSTGKNVRINSDDLARCRSIHIDLTEFLVGVKVVFAEIPVGSQSARAMTSYATCIMALATIEQPIIQLTPKELKLATTGNKEASKDEMIEWAGSTFPDAPWNRNKSGAILKKNEHLADACGAIVAGLVNEQFKSAIQLMKYAEK